MSVQTFDEFADAYEAMIDWPKRLANEQPFFRWLFDRVGVRSVLDVACGTGHHAAMFHSWGLSRVEGADVSAAMVQRCRNLWPERSGMRWAVRGFDEPLESPAGAFDAVICIGNSLALVPNRPSVDTAVRQMLAAVRPGGAVAVHVLNLWRLADGPTLWQKCLRATLDGRDSLIIKGVRRCGDRGYVEMLVSNLAASPPVLRTQSAAFWGIEAQDLSHVARQSGAGTVELYGSYQRDPYSRDSQDLILVAIR